MAVSDLPPSVVLPMDAPQDEAPTIAATTKVKPARDAPISTISLRLCILKTSQA
jgi:hypothetical protein